MNSSFPNWMLAEVALCDLDLAVAPEVILDIGANLGAFTAQCQAKWPGASVHAFEPVAETARQLEANCPLAHIHRSAVRAQMGTDQIRVGDHAAVCSFHDLGRQTDARQTVACLAASDLPAAALIKIDTEGCELEILQHLMPWHWEAAQAFVIEYHRAEDAPKIMNLLAEQGFDLLQHIRSHAPVNGILKFAKPGAASIKRRAMIGVAFGSGAPAGFVHSVMRLVRDPRLHANVQLNNGDYSVAMARNALTAQFLATDCTHLLFIDNDLVFTPEDVLRVTSHDLPVVGGIYCLKKEGPIHWCGNGFPDREEAVDQNTGLQRVRYLGTGFLCVAREVFERILVEDREQIEYTVDIPPHPTEWDFWRFGVKLTDDQRKRYLTEDWWFCQRCLELGIPVYADADVVLGHISTSGVEFPLEAQLQAEGLMFTPDGHITKRPQPQPVA